MSGMCPKPSQTHSKRTPRWVFGNPGATSEPIPRWGHQILPRRLPQDSKRVQGETLEIQRFRKQGNRNETLEQTLEKMEEEDCQLFVGGLFVDIFGDVSWWMLNGCVVYLLVAFCGFVPVCLVLLNLVVDVFQFHFNLNLMNGRCTCG